MQTDQLQRGVSAVDGSTKAKIERAAVTLFARGGVDGVSTKQLAAQAGLSEGVIYRYYKSKDELARSLMVAEHRRLAELLRAVHASEVSLQDKVSAIVDEYCAVADDDWDMFTYYLLHFHRFSDLAQDAQGSPARAAIDIVEAGQMAGVISDANSALLASMALGVVLQTATAKIYGQISGQLSDYAPQFKSAILAVLNARASV